MKVDSHLTGDWQKIPDHIKQLESDGYDSAGMNTNILTVLGSQK